MNQESDHPLLQVTEAQLQPDPVVEQQAHLMHDALPDDETRQRHRTALAVAEILRQRAEADPEAFTEMLQTAKDDVRDIESTPDGPAD